MKVAVYPGSFDPVTNGHMDLIKRGAGLFDKLILGVLINPQKHPLLSMEERIDILSELTREISNIEVKAFQGLLVDFVEREKADVILRGLRTSEDFAYELPLAQANYKMNRKADTLFLATAPEYSYISSGGVKEILHFGGDIKDMVPEVVYKRLLRL